MNSHDLDIRFRPTDFTQVNFAINECLIEQVIELLDPQSDDEILDHLTMQGVDKIVYVSTYIPCGIHCLF